MFMTFGVLHFHDLWCVALTTSIYARFLCVAVLSLDLLNGASYMCPSTCDVLPS
jgi:hypothetical protein